MKKRERSKYVNLTEKRGISLIVLIITIIVIIILAAAVILTITKNNPVSSAKESAFKEDVRIFQDDLALTVAKEYTDKQGQRDKKISTSDFDKIKNYIPSFTEKYKGKFIIQDDQLVATDKLTYKEKEWVNDVNINSVESEETNYTSEEIENSEYLYAIGKTKPEYVVAKFNDDYSEVVITKNGEDSDGVIAEFAVWTSHSPMTNKEDTLKKAVVKEGIVDLGDGGGGIGTFSSCINLESVLLPESLVKIGQDAFCSCSSLTNITIPESVTSIGGYAFSGCSSLTNITISEGVTSIGYCSFASCSSLTNITIPNSVTSIEVWSFYECSRLTNINVEKENSNYSSIDGILFNKAQTVIIKYPEGKKGTSYEIPNGVTSIGEWSFSYCSSLTNITIPNGVTSIGERAFSDCSSLTNITIPESVTSIGGRAFSDCSSLTNITYNGTQSQWNSISKNSSWKTDSVIKTITCTDGVIQIN